MKLEPGTRFGRLVVVNDGGTGAVSCVCDCGNKKTVSRKSLRSGWTRSCGCLHREMLIKMVRTHGDTGKRLHRIWKSMKTRATNKNRPKARDYALRGIGICPEWLKYAAFKEWAMANGYADNLTIDRIDNNGSYCPDNCRWTTQKEQCRNKRNTHILVYHGKTYYTIRDMCADLSLNYRRVQSRLRAGWALEDAVGLSKCKTGPRKSGHGHLEIQTRR